MHSFDVYYCQKTDKVSIIAKPFHDVLNSDDNGNRIFSGTAYRDSVDHATNVQKIIANNGILPIGQRPIALLDSSKSINIKSISIAATIYLMSTALQNFKIFVYTVCSLGNWKL